MCDKVIMFFVRKMLGVSQNSHRPLTVIATLMVALCTALGATATYAEATQASPGVHIHRYAAFSQQVISVGNKSIAAASAQTALQRTQVSVYDKQLTLNLENNARVINPSSNHSSGITLLRGTLAGIPQSWVRLTETASGTHGLIWDGAELYAVEPSVEVKDVLDESLPAPTSNSVIFKLSDTTVDLGGDYCASGDATSTTADDHSGMATYQALTAGLPQQASDTDNSPKLLLEMQVLADAAFRAEYNSDQTALDAIMVRLNNVDGIFSAQMGLAVQATDIRVLAQDPIALSTSTNAETLLSSLGQMRAMTPGMNGYASTHLFTGRDLDGDTLGIAYIGNICGARYASSLSEIRNRGAWIDSLVAAHELGHQLGAVHDGTGACTSTAAQSYLMSAFINGSEEFSQCSRNSMLATMQTAACLVPVGPPDIGLIIKQTTLNVTPGTILNWVLEIQNEGTGKTSTASVHLDLPANLMVDDSAIVGGSCVSNNRSDGGTVDCQLGMVDAYQTQQLAVTLHSTQIGTYIINASATSDNDNNPANNRAQITVVVGNDPVPVDTTSNPPATSTTPTAEQGGGGVLGLSWLLLLLSTLVGRHLYRSRRCAAQPLH